MSISPLAQTYSTLYRSPDPRLIRCYSPGMCLLDSGRLVASIDLGGPGVPELPGPVRVDPESADGWQGRIYTSDDRGRSWTHRASALFCHARPFAAGAAVWLIGHHGDLVVLRSDDGGESWSEPCELTRGQQWHQAPCNVHYAHGCVYLVMERRVGHEVAGWYVGELAPVLMRARLDADLQCPESWTFASQLSFRDVLPGARAGQGIEYAGIPFYPCPYPRGTEVAPGRFCAPMGWLETNVVRFTDPSHVWHDPSGRTFHLWMRAHTGGTGYACIAKVVEQGEKPGTGEMRTMLETAPSGRRILYVSCPGGQMKFHVLYDEKSALYWLLSTQATDSMRRPELLSADRYGLPNNERRRLQLHFSRNMVDWCFAGLVAAGPVERASRHYASMVIDGEDLHVLSRSGDEGAMNAHDGNLISFHTIRGFRALVY